MRFVIRKGALFDSRFLTASRRWGRLERAGTFTEKQAAKVAGALVTRNCGILALDHASRMVRGEHLVKAGRAILGYASRLLKSAKPQLRARLLGLGQTPQGIIRALGPFGVKDASQIGAKRYDAISDHAFLNFHTLREAQAVCEYLNNICKGAVPRKHNKATGGSEPADRGRKEA